jgi:hypothetical protein
LYLFLVIAPTVANAEPSLEGPEGGAAEAAKAIGDTTKGAVDAAGEAAGRATDAVKETVDSTTDALGDEATPGATRAKLDAMAEATLARLFKDQLGLRFDDGKAVFVLTGTSWKVAAKLTGSRCWPDEELNVR